MTTTPIRPVSIDGADAVRRTRAARAIPRPNAGQWPGLNTPPKNRFKAAIAERLFRTAVAELPVLVRWPDGSTLGKGSPDAPVMELVRPSTFFHRLGSDAKIGFGEAYMVGDWTTGPDTDLADLLTPFAARISALIHPLLQRLRNVVERTQPSVEANTVEQSPENIARHYDLSNSLFEAFLDPSMMYSSAWFEDGDDLERAQLRKIDGILDLARVKQGDHILEIGTGWGALAIRAAKERGAAVTTLTLSKEQAELARQRAEAAGVGHLVDIRLQDYRDARGEYDAVVSIEMIEAVGENFWPTYFATLDRLLKPGGRVALQSITMPHDRMQATKNAYTWIHKYIFPGGIIPSVRAIEANLAMHTKLGIVERRDLGPHYAVTLRQWRDRFNAAWESDLDQEFDATFQRMWGFYLAYCEAGFRVGYLGVSQLGLARNPFRR